MKNNINQTLGKRTWWSAAVTAAMLLVFGLSPAVAQPEPVALTEENRLPQWCGVRPSMHVVIGYDEGKRFFLVEEKARQATQELLENLCPGDKVQLASFGLDVTWHGEIVTLEGAEAAPKLLGTLKKRGFLKAPAAVNDNLIKNSLAHWEANIVEGHIPWLVVFTDSIESSAPKRPGTLDFDWTAVPEYFQGQFLTSVALMDHRAARDVAALYTVTVPKDMTVEQFPASPRANWSDVMEVFLPEPEPAPVQIKEVVRTVEVTRNPQWLTWLGSPRGSLTAGGTVFAVFLVVFLMGRLSRRQRRKQENLADNTIEGKHREVTLQLRDRLTNEVLRQETRVLREPLRVAPSNDADFVVPGPYAFEIVDEKGESPVVRSANMLGVEIKRGSRRLIVPEGDAQALRSGDRIDIGAGHEVEVQLD